MTKKDYELIAGAIKSEYDGMQRLDRIYVREGVFHAARAIAYALASDNPRFDRDKFLAACGV